MSLVEGYVGDRVSIERHVAFERIFMELMGQGA